MPDLPRVPQPPIASGMRGAGARDRGALAIRADEEHDREQHEERGERELAVAAERQEILLELGDGHDACSTTRSMAPLTGVAANMRVRRAGANARIAL